MKSIAIDLGGSRIKAGVVDNGQVLDLHMMEACSENGLQARLPALEAEIEMQLRTQTEIKGIGIAFPGLVDARKNHVVEGNGKYDDAAAFDLCRYFAEKYQLPCKMDNDANAALLGEMHFGCGRGCEDAVMLILGTGVGTAAMMGGELIRGRHHQAGCLGGHYPIQIDGNSCTCHGKGCVEAHASTWALKKLVREPRYQNSGLAGEKQMDFKKLSEYADRGDKTALEIFSYCCRCWAECVISLIYSYDPELIILSGGIMRCGTRVTEEIKNYVYQYAWTPWGKPEFRIAAAPEQSVLLGLHVRVTEE